MPKNWAYDPLVVSKYCTCEWAASKYTPDKQYTEITMDGQKWKLISIDSNCTLHGYNPEHNLPEGI